MDSWIVIFIIIALLGAIIIWLRTPFTDTEKKHLAELTRTKSRLKGFMNECYITIEKTRQIEDVYTYFLSYIDDVLRLLHTIQNDNEISRICEHLDTVNQLYIEIESEKKIISEWVAGGKQEGYDFNDIVYKLHNAGDVILLTAINTKKALLNRDLE